VKLSRLVLFDAVSILVQFLDIPYVACVQDFFLRCFFYESYVGTQLS